ncbi:hypothetical protein BDN72DRAFT_774502, partial [Pluteus cervinus]
FLGSADELFGPITTVRQDGRIIKKIPWTAFQLNDEDWERVKDVVEILQDILHYFSSETKPTLWRVIPAIEELFVAWSEMAMNPKLYLYHDAIDAGREKIRKWYKKFEKKDVGILSLALHPFYKLAYIELLWGGAEQQESEVRNGNSNAKNWVDEARKVLETTVGHDS